MVSDNELPQDNAYAFSAETLTRQGLFELFGTVTRLVSNYAYSFLVAPDGTLSLEWATGGFKKTTGFSLEEARDRGGWAKLVHSEDLPVVRDRAKTLLAGERDVSEFRILTKTGEVRWLRDHGEPQKALDSDRVVRIIGIAQDITEQKSAQEGLHKSEEKFRLLAETSLEDIWQLDKNGQVTYASPAVLNIFGYSQEEAMRLGFPAFFPDSELERATQAFTNALAGEKYQILEFTGRRKDGSSVPIEVSVTPILVEGQISGVQGIARDITARKQAQEALRENQRLLAQIADTVPYQIYVFNLVEGKNTYINRKAEAFYGLTLSELQAMGQSFFFDIIHPDDLQKLEAFNGQWETAQVNQIFEKEYRLKNKAGEYRWVRSYESVLNWDDEGNPIDIIGTAIDITESKQAKIDLQESETDLKSAQRYAHVGNWTWDIKNNRVTWSDEMHRIFGLDPETFSGDLSEVITRAIHPEDREAVERSNLNVLQEKTPIPLEYRIIHPDGEIRTVWAEAGDLILDQEGNPMTLKGYVQDITEKKAAEEALRRSEERFRTIVNVLPQFVFYTDKDLNYRFVNKTFQDELGINPDDLIGKPMPAFIGAEAFEQARPHVEKALRGERVRYYETLAFAIGGSRHIDGTLIPDRTEKGEVVGYYGILTDISHYMEMHQALGTSEANLSALIENTDDLIWSVDREYRLIVGNSNFHQDIESAIEKPFSQGDPVLNAGFPTEALDEWQQFYDRAFNGETFRVEIPRNYQDTSQIMEYRFSPIRNPEGKVTGATVLGNNITQRVKAEVERQRLLEQVIADANELEKRVQERTEQFQTIIDLTADREIRMAELKRVIKKLRRQLQDAGLEPIANDPLLEDLK